MTATRFHKHAPHSVEELSAERKEEWRAFTRFVAWGVAATVILLIGMRIFLV